MGAGCVLSLGLGRVRVAEERMTATWVADATSTTCAFVNRPQPGSRAKLSGSYAAVPCSNEDR